MSENMPSRRALLSLAPSAAIGVAASTLALPASTVDPTLLRPALARPDWPGTPLDASAAGIAARLPAMWRQHDLFDDAALEAGQLNDEDLHDACGQLRDAQFAAIEAMQDAACNCKPRSLADVAALAVLAAGELHMSLACLPREPYIERAIPAIRAIARFVAHEAKVDLRRFAIERYMTKPDELVG